jgi:hypothetical protein
VSRGGRALNSDVRRLMRPQRLAILVTCAVSIAACGLTFDVPQKVVVHLAENGYPIPNVKLRYYAKPKCSSGYVEAVTDSGGFAHFARVAHRGRYAVVLEKPSLCRGTGDAWSQIWTTTHDPPDELLLDCDAYARPSDLCIRVVRKASNDRWSGP